MDKAIQRFKDFVMDNIVIMGGGNIEFSTLEDDDLDRLIQLAKTIKTKRREGE